MKTTINLDDDLMRAVRERAVAMLAEPTSDQREAFNLIGTPIPLTLT